MYLPKLFVAIDSCGNKILYRDAKKDERYMCPICGGDVKLRAMDSDFIQAHFYHLSEACSDESIAHWIYKYWLFDIDSSILIDKEEYQVENVLIEASFDTTFGEYVPDITVHTTCGKTIFVEINFSSSKRDTDYFCKWSELENIVIEVDVKRALQSDKFTQGDTYNVLYAEGVCRKKEYIKKDEYALKIQPLKQSWKKSDQQDYLSRWNKLDWFWAMLRRNKLRKCSVEDVVEAFSAMSWKDAEECYVLLRNATCMSQTAKNMLGINLDDRFTNYIREVVNETKYGSLQIEKHKNSLQTYTINLSFAFVIHDRRQIAEFKIKHISRSGFLSSCMKQEVVSKINNEANEACRLIDKEIATAIDISFINQLDGDYKVTPRTHLHYSWKSYGTRFKSDGYYKLTSSTRYHVIVYDKDSESGAKRVVDTLNLSPIEFSEKLLSDAYSTGVDRMVNQKYVSDTNEAFNNNKSVKQIKQLSEKYSKGIMGRICPTPSIRFEPIHTWSGTRVLLVMGLYTKELLTINRSEYSNVIDSDILSALEDELALCRRLSDVCESLGNKVNECKNEMWRFSISTPSSKKTLLSIRITLQVEGVLDSDYINIETLYDGYDDDSIYNRIKNRVAKTMRILLSKNKVFLLSS